MRIISQKGMPVIIDLPYEYVAVSQSMEEPSCIIAYDVTARDDSFFRMARYSTPEKAEKAMQKLHECYTGGLFLMKNIDIPGDEMEKIRNMTSGFITVYDRNDNVKIEPMNIVFGFPQEDEL